MTDANSTARSTPVAVVTGGASGIGRAIVERLSEGGYRVVAVDIDEAGLKRLADDVRGTECEPLDVSQADATSALVERLERSHGVPAVLVNSAGLLQSNVVLDELDSETHDHIWRVNYHGTYYACRAFGLAMAKAGRGAIVNIASVTGLRPLPLVAYGPGKAAIVSLTATLAGHLGPHGVRVNAIAPGYVLTPAMKAKVDAGERDVSTLQRAAALRRLVDPSEVAEAVAFLAAPGASAITGVTLPVDAGWLATSAWGTYGGASGA